MKVSNYENQLHFVYISTEYIILSSIVCDNPFTMICHALQQNLKNLGLIHFWDQILWRT